MSLYISQQIAAKAVSSVLNGRNLTLALPEALRAFPQATVQQKGGGGDLSYGTLRFYGAVNAYLTQLLEKPLDNTDVSTLLLVAIYQLLHDQADDFTVVNQAVKAAGYAKPRWAKGLVNGVLRNFLRKKAILAQHSAGDEVAKFSYPQWWIDKIKHDYPEQWTSILNIGNSHPPMTLRMNSLKTDIANYMAVLSQAEIAATHIDAQAIMLNKPMPVDHIPLFSDGAVSVQDYGAQLAAVLLDTQKGERVLDACAAPGGKTSHLLERSAVKLLAIDNDATRIDRIESNLKRLHLKAELKVADATKAKSWWDGQPYDAILADVPCSASGIVRRHVDIKWLRRESDIDTFVQQQRSILQSLWPLLAKGGKLLYATCSIFNEENQQQIDYFLQKNSNAKQLPLSLVDGATEKLHIHHGQLIPSTQHDGFFYALLQKH